jgi:hypothetical protein
MREVNFFSREREMTPLRCAREGRSPAAAAAAALVPWLDRGVGVGCMSLVPTERTSAASCLDQLRQYVLLAL